MQRFIRKTYLTITHGLAILAVVLLALITLGIGAEAILRSLELSGIRGIVDFAEYSLLSIVFLAAPWILIHDGHICIKILPNIFSNRKTTILRSIREFICALLCLALAYYSLEMFIASFLRGEYVFQELVVLEWWLQWQAPTCFILMSVEFFRRFYNFISSRNTSDESYTRF